MQVEDQEIEQARGAPSYYRQGTLRPEWLNELLELDPSGRNKNPKVPQSDPDPPSPSAGAIRQ